MGDIVLTTPVIRSIKRAHPNWELHFLTKPAYQDLLIHNPYIDHLHLLEDQFGKQIGRLREEAFDYLIDLHNNLRTLRLRLGLRIPTTTFNKQNLAKYKMVRFKKRKLVISHIVQRYGECLNRLEVELDEEGLDLFLPDDLNRWAKGQLSEAHCLADAEKCLAVVLGATFATKRWIPEYFAQTIEGLQRPVLLLGGKDARAEADIILEKLHVPVFDAVGKFDLLKSAALLRQCQEVLTHDTGFMHIAAAFGMKTYSLWGSTVPELGMTPYKTPHRLIENKELGCRPCSKIGFDRCPKGHFRCMKEMLPDQVMAEINQGIS
ncbi:MAG: glycosyltransferase family 9 protein [Bacteroidota bacterium]